MKNYRNDFPILTTKTMLSSCSQSAMSSQVLHAFKEYENSLLVSGMDWNEWMRVTNLAKEKFATLINCDPSEIAILGSVSDCISSVLNALPLSGREVVTTSMDFPCIGQSILAQQKKKSFELKFIPNQDYIIPIESYEKYVTDNTALTCIPHVSFYNGFKQDLRAVSEIVHRKGSLLFVDAYQSAGAVSIDVKKDNIDILVAGMQKYLLGVPGIAFMYIRKDLAESLEPSTIGWFGQKDIFGFHYDLLEYADSAQRFNTGTPPVINAYIANAALEYILNVGVEAIEAHLTELSEFTFQEAIKRNLQLYSPTSASDRGSATAIYCKDANRMEQLLRNENLILSARKDCIRLAPHFYNTKGDIIKALDAIVKHLPETLA
ncbi:aminotransferase class V-fold PLP-dependent enzyme [Sporosarcina oncorhynchi]|uniref:Aminotransferase class V-fold PLP-dependent enzyme n=1 Tax=Sporosarcina oncorhynchi TaxID=3056444 RepID=A0ABZ0L8V8_9BACL|nr:aminotransferase class V-fold PLP-dependent enzyme [Sporosarcina sp. T2O-4]WOV88077.1 aminotransferase class V-fold PLP-dependent enzyme [Sporosarcina sp. T2O-4]